MRFKWVRNKKNKKFNIPRFGNSALYISRKFQIQIKNLNQLLENENTLINKLKELFGAAANDDVYVITDVVYDK